MKLFQSLAGLVLIVATVASIPLAKPLLAQQTGSQPQVSRVDRTLGEEEQILLRREWFLSTRRAGADSDEALAALRKAGVQVTRDAIARQQGRRTDGTEAAVNFWVARGTVSQFGGWAFGTIAGRTPSIAADWNTGTLYAATASGGLWKSINDGLSWTQLFDTAGTMTVGTVALDPNDADVVWAGTGENNQGCESYFGIGLLRSPDGGLTWETRNGSGANTLEELASFANVVVDPRNSSHIITGGRIRGCADGSSQNGGIYTSTDAGLNWTKRLADRQVYEIAQDPIVLDTYWAGTNAGVYKSTDNAVSWTLQTASGLPNGSPGRTEIAISPSDSNVVYALFSGGAQFWRTLDGGATWTQMATGSDACDGQCTYNMVIRVHRTDPNTVYRGTVHVFKTTDGGLNWTDLSNNWGSSQKVHQDTHHLLMDPNNPDTFYVGCDGGIWKSIDGGASFLNRNGDMNTFQFYAIHTRAEDPDTICGGAQDNSSLARTTSDVWDLQTVTGDGFVCGFDPVDLNYAYITSYPSGGTPSLYRSTSGTLGSFSRKTGSGSGIISGDRINWVTPWLLDPTSPNTIYIGTHRMYRSDDRADNWTQVGPDDLTGGSGSLLSLELNRSFPDVLYSGSASGKVWRTTDGGSNWTDITAGLPAGRSINDIAGDPTNPDRAFVVVGGFNTDHLWEWNLGVGWVARGVADLPNLPTNTVLLLDESDMIVGNDGGMFRSADGGLTFTPYMDGLPQGLVVTDLKYNNLQNIVTAGTYGRGAWQVDVDPVRPIVVFDSIELPMIEIDGDNDGMVEPGETWEVRPILRNGGGTTALGVLARLATSTPGIHVLEPQSDSFGDIDPGLAGSAVSGFQFTVDPTFPCADSIVFDIVDITSMNGSGVYADVLSAFTVQVVGQFGTPVPANLFVEDFDSGASDWSHEAIDPGIIQCYNFPFFDEWNLASKDAGHGTSYHLGNGPSGAYGRRNNAWLHYGGKDSLDGPGFDIPADAVSATLTVEHWYNTIANQDGGQVAIDAVLDGADNYTTITPNGGYPGGTLSGTCNALDGQEAFSGSSGGWVTHTFDLLQFKGKKVYLAFIFASDNGTTSVSEGWYVDQMSVDYSTPGSPQCDQILWPGSVANAQFNLTGPGTIEATWADSCNLGELPSQTYSIHAGDLNALHQSGSYTHAPVAGACNLTSPASFGTSVGSEYYLLSPNEGGREGGAGADSGGASRPQPNNVCGERREATCP